ncbi:MAG: hypothetical protein R3283_00350 [Balneolaceae bacterium]|nr:hypothetical protein [Balneolaceae bacterium]
MEEILIINLFSSFFLCGLIWTVQLVHYPSFHGFEKEKYAGWMAFHKSRISIIVVPVMLAELGSSVLLSFVENQFLTLNRAGLAVVILIWLITFFVQVPLHGKLSSGYREEIVRKLVTSNLWRTSLWTIKSILGIILLTRIL